MKELLVCGIDDGYFPLAFKGKKGSTILLSAKYNKSKLSSVNFDRILVDGNDATAIILRIVDECDIVLTDGVTFGGFNYIDPQELQTNGIHYIIFYSQIPEINEVERALTKYFSDDEKRVNIILQVMRNLVKLPTKKGEVYVKANIPESDVIKVVSYYQFYAKQPEPLRSAHIIASSLSRFLINKKLLT
ncbi:DUF99 family protein [Stygiolobus caldivivus]|uniref:UPF0215 protein KN1_18660 n=1 Tax=Stygiolobus caldivivus TaxID=2824673 RepID=A0A8D5U892_9CREN|nr:DUF99 family protein [Stygiolobus caldivivus]BCU70569.1 hypothetical protein KN1_18660 [Stygiolobus caldivivus]